MDFDTGDECRHPARAKPPRIFHILIDGIGFGDLGGATGGIPTDRIIDGIDQTALWLLGEPMAVEEFLFMQGTPMK